MNGENNVEVNVEEIMHEIKKTIQMRKEAASLQSFESIPIQGELNYAQSGRPSRGNFVESLDYIKQNYAVPYYWDFGAHSIRNLLKRVIRRLAKCILFPILTNQNLLNSHFFNCLDQIYCFTENTRKTERELRQNLELLQEAQQNEMEKIRSRLQKLEEQNYLNMSEQENIRKTLEEINQSRQLSNHTMKSQQSQYFSQSGEDMIVDYILRMMGIAKEKCTYLDLGANHAKELSNTYSLYLSGARGVLVEANPALINELKLCRPEDVVLNRCIAPKSGINLPFYIFNGDGLSTMNRSHAKKLIKINPNLGIEQTVMVESITVNEIMDTYFEGAPVFMNLDLEGEELNVLESINFNIHRPLIISIELIPYSINLTVGEKDSKILSFMEQNNYLEYAFTGINSIFIDKNKMNISGNK